MHARSRWPRSSALSSGGLRAPDRRSGSSSRWSSSTGPAKRIRRSRRWERCPTARTRSRSAACVVSSSTTSARASGTCSPMSTRSRSPSPRSARSTARTSDGEHVAVKVQQPGVAEAVDADLRNLGLVTPIIKRLAPGLDAGAMLAELRERISDELDYEMEAQNQRRLERRFRGHPHVRLPRVYTELSTRRVLVTEYVEGLRADEIKHLGDAERDRIGEIAFRFYFGLVWRDGVVAGDPHPENCIVCPDGRLCLLDFGLLRDLEADYLEGERDITRAVADHDPQRVHDGLSSLGYLPEPGSFDPEALLEFLATAGEWRLAHGVRRIEPEDVSQTLALGYPPRSPYFALMRRLSMPPATLLLRRMEVQVLMLLGDFRAEADWGAITAEHHSGKPVSTALGREESAFLGSR